MPTLRFFLPLASFHEAHDHNGYEDENLGGRNASSHHLFIPKEIAEADIE